MSQLPELRTEILALPPAILVSVNDTPFENMIGYWKTS